MPEGVLHQPQGCLSSNTRLWRSILYSYIKFCDDIVTVNISRVTPNRKPWLTMEVKGGSSETYTDQLIFNKPLSKSFIPQCRNYQAA
ncbi:hypothetical protein D4764_15G0009960 [Takifugu flavidus]|uniref:Uncharacterized protein n=1 Tax=Takifugu flavidus TaxID=433684 RepID=A0A5C6P1C4_9TELE|nr:hypothetical protein D4764_15G0009960 [Takifugu flavidus]